MVANWQFFFVFFSVIITTAMESVRVIRPLTHSVSVLTAETRRVLHITHPVQFHGLPTGRLAFHPGRQSIRLGPLPVLRPQRERRQRYRAAAGCPR